MPKEERWLKTKKPNKTIRAYAFGIAQYSADNSSLNIEMKITNRDFIQKVISGELRGLSTAYVIREWECSICHGDLEECPHEVGEKYDNAICQMIAKDAKPIEMSVVQVPKDPRCRIIDMLIVKNDKLLEFTWYGFRVNAEMDRFKNIQKAYESGLISEKAAFFFAKFFIVHSEGKAIFSQSDRKKSVL